MRIVKNGLHYPIEAFQNFHPHVHGVPSKEILEKYGWQVLLSDPEPTDTSRIHKRGPVEYRNGEPYWTWVSRPKTPDDFENDKALERKAIRSRRDKALVAGTTVNGVTVATDNVSQQRITGVALAATVDASITVRWKLPDSTFVTLTAAQIIDIAQGVRTHIQACFDREAELLAALEAGQSYDIDAGWPS